MGELHEIEPLEVRTPLEASLLRLKPSMCTAAFIAVPQMS